MANFSTANESMAIHNVLSNGSSMNGTVNNTTTHHHFVSAEGGIFSGKGLLHSPLALFLVQATIIITLSRSVHFFLQKLRQPRVIAEIIGGICLGPSVFGHIPGFTETIFPKQSLPILSMVSSFGLVLYMFLMGLEMDTAVLSKGVQRFLVISLAGIIVPGLLGSAISFGLYEFLLEPEKREATPFSSFLLFTFVALAITAFPVLARILTETKLLSTRVGMMCISAAAVDDIFAWVLLALVISIINAGDPFTAVYVLISCAFYALLLLIPGRILLKKSFEKFLGHRDTIITPTLLAFIFALIFLSAWTTEWLGVHAIFGAFLVGIAIPRMGGITITLTHKLEDLVSIAFLPLYFASSGLKTKLGLINDWPTVLFLVLVVAVACSGKIIGCTIAARFSGFPWREAFSIGVLMNTKGLVELIVLNIGLDAGVINDRIFVVMVLMALITTFMTAPIISYVYPVKYQRKFTMVQSRTRIGSTSGGIFDRWAHPGDDDHVLVYLRDMDSVPMVSSLLQMFRATEKQKQQLFLSALKTITLSTFVERSSSIIVSTQTELVIRNDPTLKMFQFFGQLIGVKTKSFVATCRNHEIGDEIGRIVSEQGCEIVLIPWGEQAQQQSQDNGNTSSSCLSNDRRDYVSTLSILNSEHSATVMVYVDRRISEGLINPEQKLTSMGNFHGIIVPFIGGANDRSALQLAYRFHLGNPGAKLKLIILHLKFVSAGSSRNSSNSQQSTEKKNAMAPEDFALLNELKEMAKKGESGRVSPAPDAAINTANTVSFKKVKIHDENYTPLLDTLKKLQSQHTAIHGHLLILGHSLRREQKDAPKKLQMKGGEQAEVDGTERKRAPSFIRQLSQSGKWQLSSTENAGAKGTATEDEQIFGHLGEMLLADPKCCSAMLVVHEPQGVAQA